MVMCFERFVIVLSVCLLLFCCDVKAGGGNCNKNTDCGENALCINNNCKCDVGFFDFPPFTLAVSEGCLGQCDELGNTNQCEGNTQCTISPLGYGECTCPSETYGPPQCLDDCESNLQCSFRGNCENGKCVCFSGFEGKHCDISVTTSRSPGINLPLLLGAVTLPLLLLVPAGLVSSLNSG